MASIDWSEAMVVRTTHSARTSEFACGRPAVRPQTRGTAASADRRRAGSFLGEPKDINCREIEDALASGITVSQRRPAADRQLCRAIFLQKLAQPGLDVLANRVA